jgi:hypothetical protein
MTDRQEYAERLDQASRMRSIYRKLMHSIEVVAEHDLKLSLSATYKEEHQRYEQLIDDWEKTIEYLLMKAYTEGYTASELTLALNPTPEVS